MAGKSETGFTYLITLQDCLESWRGESLGGPITWGETVRKPMSKWLPPLLTKWLDSLIVTPGRNARLITFVEDRPGHDRRYAIDTSRVGREIGWQPETDFAPRHQSDRSMVFGEPGLDRRSCTEVCWSEVRPMENLSGP